MPRHRYTILVEWDDDTRCYVGYVPALNWLADQGATEAELQQRITEAIRGWLEVAAAHGDPVPAGDPPGPLVPPWRPRPTPHTTQVDTPSGPISLRFAPA